MFTEFMRLLLVISGTTGLNLRTINPMWGCLVGTVKNDSIACHICDICLGGMNITIFENYVKNSGMKMMYRMWSATHVSADSKEMTKKPKAKSLRNVILHI